MEIRAAEISSILKEQIQNFGKEAEVSEIGQVLSVGDGIARVYGLDRVQAGEMVEFQDGTKGMGAQPRIRQRRRGYLWRRPQHYGRSDGQAHRGDRLKSPSARVCSAALLMVSVTRSMARAPIEATERLRVDVKAPGILPRKSVHEPMATGLKAVDALIPIGRGQRELIIGDRQTGKTAIILDTFLNQKPLNDGDDEFAKLYCVYVAVGQKRSTVAQFVKVLEERGALPYSIVVAATASDPSANAVPSAIHRLHNWASISATTACMP